MEEVPEDIFFMCDWRQNIGPLQKGNEDKLGRNMLRWFIWRYRLIYKQYKLTLESSV